MALSFFEIRKKTDLFQSWGLYWVFQISWHIECSTLLPLSLRIWNGTAGTASTPLALFLVMLPKAHLTSHSRISGSRWVSHHHGYLAHENLFFFFNYILFYNTVLVLPYINMNPPRVYTCSQSWTPVPLPSPYHLSGSSQCTSPKYPIFRIEPRLVVRFLYDIIHVSMPFSKSSHPLPLP